MKPSPRDPTHITAETVDRAAVAKVAGHVQIRDIRVMLLHGSLNCAPKEIDKDWASKARIGFDSHVVDVAEDRSGFSVRAFFSADHRVRRDVDADQPAGEESRPPDLDLNIVLELLYTVDSDAGLTSTDFDHFAFLNSTFNAWPYFREIAHSTTHRMGVPPLVVPVRTVRPIPAQQ